MGLISRVSSRTYRLFLIMSAIWSERTTQCEIAASNFVDIYYKSFDNKDNHRRKNLQKLYTDNAQLNFRGHCYRSPSNIATFQDSLPETEHRIDSLDVQPLAGDLGDLPTDHQSAPLACVINVAGTVGYRTQTTTDPNRRYKSDIYGFTQGFMLLATITPGQSKPTWKVMSDST